MINPTKLSRKYISHLLRFLAIVIVLIPGFANAQSGSNASAKTNDGACGEASVCMLKVEKNQAKIDAAKADLLDETLVSLKDALANFYTKRGQVVELRSDILVMKNEADEDEGERVDLRVRVGVLLSEKESRVAPTTWVAIGTGLGAAIAFAVVFFVK